MKKIGVTSCFFYPTTEERAYAKKTLSYIEMDLANYIASKDVMPVLIPMLKDQDALESFCGQLDGLVLQGGSDVCPRSYGADFLDREKWPGDSIRDRYELKIIDLFFKAQKSIFAICRGHQILNVYFGGTLYQDLKTELKIETIHRDGKAYDEIYHEIDFVKDSVITQIYPHLPQRVVVNSVHHQGIKTLGRDLIVMAYCEENRVIEAYHHRDMQKHYILSVQWHPEFSETLKEKVISPLPLLNHFLASVHGR